MSEGWANLCPATRLDQVERWDPSAKAGNNLWSDSVRHAISIHDASVQHVALPTDVASPHTQLVIQQWAISCDRTKGCSCMCV